MSEQNPIDLYVDYMKIQRSSETGRIDPNIRTEYIKQLKKSFDDYLNDTDYSTGGNVIFSQLYSGIIEEIYGDQPPYKKHTYTMETRPGIWFRVNFNRN